MVPKYEIIHQTLLKQIEAGTLVPGTLLSSENELAEEYGVSLITVRRAMTELAKDGAIRRVRGKGSFVERRTPEKSYDYGERVIAFLLNHDNNAAVSITRIISGVQDVIAQRGYRLLVDWNVMNGPIERATIDRMLSNRAEGFIIYPFDPDADKGTYARMEALGLPYVVLDRYPHDHFCAYVGSDNFVGGRLALRAFADRGHRRLAVLGNLIRLSSEQERIAGFIHTARELGGDVRVRIIHPEEREALPHIIASEGITGLFCVNDRNAARAIQLLSASGYSVPEDVSVIGFDDCFFDASVNLQFSSVRQDFIGIGHVGAQMLLGMIQSSKYIPTKQMLGVQMIERASSLAAPKKI
ncbi:MAG: LacI family DNA-binding transcriptional regulator [Clostridia bacterium]|nr:LacI family DNA-binding transcriptional regulator [Clostridia bacterium]